MSQSVFLGIDCGATTSKVGAVDHQGEPLTTQLHQSETRGEAGADSILAGWMEGVEGFLRITGLSWHSVAGVGLAIPGPYLDYGVLGRMPNLPASLEGWRFLEGLRQAVTERAGRPIRVETANDGQLAGVPEARVIQKESPGSVLMLAPGSGLGCSFVHANGSVFGGDHQAGVILCHMPAPHESLGLPRFPCGCGRDWGCFEAYTSISGLPRLLEHVLPKYPGHELASSPLTPKARALTLRGRAQQGDPLALEIFDLQAVALGQAVAAGCMAYDPTHVVIGGGLMDRSATTPAFRERFIEHVRRSAARTSWVDIQSLSFHQATFGDLSQAIGAALMIRSLV
ncbi:MAG: ROK family protein [Terrimicrobiaceae bacterium]|nr:ROK family protein [Terrimicrobiaceae bacterium]